ncbi:MAG: VCBS repeat-containing protein [Flavobacteriales bacterium]|nr:VCBS repeat-containing protein [Flavobacteriales bacterium]
MMLTRNLLALIPSLVLGQVNGQFTEHDIDTSLTLAARDVAIGDLDSDGDQDVLAITSGLFFESIMVWYANDGTGNFALADTVYSVGGGKQVEVADTDGDGDLDVMRKTGNSTYLHKNMGAGMVWEMELVGGPVPMLYGFVLADLSVDDVPDLILYQHGSPVIRTMMNDGAGNFLPEQVVTGWANDPIQMSACDADGDGDNDLVYLSPFNDEMVWQENLGGGVFANHVVLCNYDPDGWSVCSQRMLTAMGTKTSSSGPWTTAFLRTR